MLKPDRRQHAKRVSSSKGNSANQLPNSATSPATQTNKGGLFAIPATLFRKVLARPITYLPDGATLH